MGTDITMFVETRGHEGEWKLVIDQDATWSDRSYAVFGVLAGVRGSHPPIAKLRGVPQDASRQVRSLWAYEHDACHSASWLLLSEILDHVWPEDCAGFAHWVQSLVETDSRLARMPSDQVRFVFWFDS